MYKRQLTKKTWGPKPKLMRWAFAGIVRPMISYGALVWGHEAKTFKEKLRRLNRMAINTFCSIPKSTPTRFLEIALDIMPLDKFIEKEAMKAFSRLRKVLEFGWDGKAKRKTLSVSHMKYWSDKAERINSWEVDDDKIKVKLWEILFKTDMNPCKCCLLYTSPSPRD